MTSELRITDEPIGFTPDELVRCSRCGKSNAPDRVACLYCGSPLAGRGEATVSLRKLEDWEAGSLLIAEPDSVPADTARAAALLGIEDGVLRSMLSAGTHFPVARVESEKVAESASAKLAELGIKTRIVDEKALNVESMPTRLRGLAIKDGEIVTENFNSGEQDSFAAADVVLFVTGRIVETRRDEVTKRKKSKTKLLDQTQSESELMLVDLYTSRDAVGYRIQTSGFDFSVLGDEKQLVASQNIVKLTELLRDTCANAFLVDEYDSVRGMLDMIWEPIVRRNAHVFDPNRRALETSYTSSNFVQFTKYSRMRRLLI